MLYLKVDNVLSAYNFKEADNMKKIIACILVLTLFTGCSTKDDSGSKDDNQGAVNTPDSVEQQESPKNDISGESGDPSEIPMYVIDYFGYGGVEYVATPLEDIDDDSVKDKNEYSIKDMNGEDAIIGAIINNSDSENPTLVYEHPKNFLSAEIGEDMVGEVMYLVFDDGDYVIGFGPAETDKDRELRIAQYAELKAK